MNNIPVVKLGLIAVSRDCFPIQLSEKRRAAIQVTYKGELYECPVTVENEKDMEKALEDVNKADCNALVVFLGNFGPETPETLIAERFEGPCMYVAAAEGDGDMINGRGDAYCGMLNCSYNLKMRHLKAYIPEYPVGTADDIAKRKKLRYREDILDNMGSEELIANLFRISQTEQKLKRDDVNSESKANKTHYEVGSKIRNTIKELGGTMPEDLPTPDKSLKELEKENKKIKIDDCKYNIKQ